MRQHYANSRDAVFAGNYMKHFLRAKFCVKSIFLPYRSPVILTYVQSFPASLHNPGLAVFSAFSSVNYYVAMISTHEHKISRLKHTHTFHKYTKAALRLCRNLSPSCPVNLRSHHNQHRCHSCSHIPGAAFSLLFLTGV